MADTALVEQSVRHLLWYVAIFGSFTSTIFFGMVMVAAFRYVLHTRRDGEQGRSTSPQDLPAVTILKPVHGMEPKLEETLESFFQQEYSNFEIVFGARNVSNEALVVVEKLRAKYPHVPTRVVISGEPSWPNAKVFSLARMLSKLSGELLIP